MRLRLVLFLSLFFLWLAPRPLMAFQPVTLHLFYSTTCPHCTKARAFIATLPSRYPDLTIKQYNVAQPETQLLLSRIDQDLNLEISGVPLTLICNQPVIGFLSSETTGTAITSLIQQGLAQDCPDIFASAFDASLAPASNTTPTSTPSPLILPFLGNTDLRQLSLPLLTVILAAIDGFNPCAMWVLIFLISLLIGVESRRRLLLGTAFILASGLTYFLFLASWLNLFLFLGFLSWIRYAIGALAVAAGFYYLRDFFTNPSGSCHSLGGSKHPRVITSLKALVTERHLGLALVGIILLAFAVNLVELACSAGLPAIYTHLLSLSDLPTWQYYAYLGLYILIFMLDDLFVFATAMVTLKLTGVEGKYARYSHLIGGVLILTVGLILILKPQLLSFA